jgi:uncharacterized protein
MIVLFCCSVCLHWTLDARAAMDCSRATTNVDRMLCSSSRAAVAEERMAYAFRAAVRRGVAPEELRSSQLRWKTQVRDACNDVDCLVSAYEQRIAELDGLGSR